MTLHSRFLLGISLLITLILGNSTYGQFYKVYGYATLEAGELELVYWNSYTGSSDHRMGFFDTQVDREGLVAHSLEVEYGLSHRFTVAMYLDFLDPPGMGMKYIGTKALMSYYRFYEKGSRPLDIALYIEYILPQKGYKDSEELEAKIILVHTGIGIGLSKAADNLIWKTIFSIEFR